MKANTAARTDYYFYSCTIRRDKLNCHKTGGTTVICYKRNKLTIE